MVQDSNASPGHSTRSRPRESCSRFALFRGSLCSVIAVALASKFFFVEAAQSVRPMAFASAVSGIAVAACLVGMPTGLIGLFGDKKGLAALGITLSLAPLPLAIGMLRLAAALKGFHIAD